MVSKYQGAINFYTEQQILEHFPAPSCLFLITDSELAFCVLIPVIITIFDFSVVIVRFVASV